MPSLEVTDSKLNSKCANIRTFFQKGSKPNNKKCILINIIASIPLSEFFKKTIVYECNKSYKAD